MSRRGFVCCAQVSGISTCIEFEESSVAAVSERHRDFPKGKKAKLGRCATRTHCAVSPRPRASARRWVDVQTPGQDDDPGGRARALLACQSAAAISEKLT